MFDPTILALKILNRCFTFQIESMILNQTDDLLAQVVKENQREVTIREFAAEPDYTMAVSERLQDELLSASRKSNKADVNYELLYQLARAMCNILMLTMDQMALVRSMHRTGDPERNLSQSLIHLLVTMPADLLVSVLSKNQVRNFTLFLTHSLRLLIIMQAVDKNCLQGSEQ